MDTPVVEERHDSPYAAVKPVTYTVRWWLKEIAYQLWCIRAHLDEKAKERTREKPYGDYF